MNFRRVLLVGLLTLGMIGGASANYFTATAYLFENIVLLGVIVLLVTLGLMVFQKRKQTAGGL